MPGLEMAEFGAFFLISPVLGLSSQCALATPSSRVLMQMQEMRLVEGLACSKHSLTPTSALGEAHVLFAFKREK